MTTSDPSSDSSRPDGGRARILEEALADVRAETAGQARTWSHEELTARFPDLEILELIGRGGMGAVYKARQKRLDRTVALKVLPPDLAEDPEFGARFHREAQALASLNHPNIITVHDYGENEGAYHLVTEYVDGVDLRKLLDLGALSPAEALRITPKICEALHFAHQHGVVHRDVKPENILVDTKGQVKIADFGLAKVARPGDPIALTRPTAVFGTPNYMAPEQFRGSGAVDHRADIFSLGVVLYEMLTGQLPMGSFDPPSKLAGVSPGLDEIVKRTLAQQPENRYQSAEDVQRDVEGEASGRPTRPTPAPAPASPAATVGPIAKRSDPMAKLPFAALAVALLTLLGAGFAGVLAQSGRVVEIHRYHDVQNYERGIRHVVAKLNEGDASIPASQLPVWDWVSPRPWIAPEACKLVAAGVMLSGTLLVVLLGFWGMRRVRARAGRLRGGPFAIVMAWLPLLLVADGLVLAPVQLMDGRSVRQGLTFLSVLVLLAANVWFLVWRVRRERVLCTDPVEVAAAGRNGWFLAGILGCVLLLCGTLVGMAFVDHGYQTHQMERGPMRPSDLVGRSRADVLRRLGPPSTISASASTQTWGYRGPDESVAEDALVLSGNRVVACSDTAVVLLDNPFPRSGPYLGQTFAEWSEFKKGSPTVTTGSLATHYSYPDGIDLSVVAGVIVGFDR